MEVAHYGFHVAIVCHLVAMHSACMLLTTALNVEVVGAKCLGSVVTGKVPSEYRSKRSGHK